MVEVLNTLLWSAKCCPSQPYTIMQCDLTKAYNSIDHQALLDTLADIGLPVKFSTLMASILTNLTGWIWLSTSLSPQFHIQCSIQQGCLLSPLLFTLALGHCM